MNFQNTNDLVWMELPGEYRSKENSHFLLLPVSYEKDVTYGVGATKGAKEIILASKHLEYYDEQFDVEYFESGVFVHPLLDLSKETPETMVANVQEAVVANGKGKFVLGLGGDHAVTLGFVRGLEKTHSDFAILQIDAHSDFRDSWNGSRLNHACVMRQLVSSHEIVSVGIRSQDKDERKAVDSHSNVQTIYSWEHSLEKLREALLKLHSSKLYITIDVDGFDPSVISCTGTPEPGGLLWQQVIDVLKLCFEMKKVIGADIVEFAPLYDSNGKKTNQSRIEAYVLARLASKIISLAKK